MLVVAANWFSWGLPEGLFDAAEIRHGIHAGAVETAMMLAVRPDLVDMAAAADFVPVTVADDVDYPRLRALGAAGLGLADAGSACARVPAATPTKATAEAGRAVIDHAARLPGRAAAGAGQVPAAAPAGAVPALSVPVSIATSR